jgi:hypothetical protein
MIDVATLLDFLLLRTGGPLLHPELGFLGREQIDGL